MTRHIITLAVIAAIFLLTVEGITTIGVKQARCSGCISVGMECYYAGQCGSECICLKDDGIKGTCVGLGVK